jgi:cysteine desulfurase
VPGTQAETLVIGLDLDGIAVSAGSACSSGKVEPSHVLSAMGVGSELARGAIRVSLGFGTTRRDIERFIKAWAALIKRRKDSREAA